MDRAFVRCLLLASAVALPAMIALMAVYFRPGGDLLEQRGYYIGLDFVNYWTGGRLALTGRVGILYDVAAYNELLREWFAPAKEFMIFSYPPNALPLFAPVGLFPYLVAFLLWLVLSTAAFFVVALGARPTRSDLWLVVALALSPILWVNLNFGQLGLFLALLFVGALRLLPTRPILAGIMIGLLTIKPQLGVLLPLTLVLVGAWRAFAAAALTALLLVGLSLVLYGVEPWQAWWGATAKLQWGFMTDTHSFFTTQKTTPFSALRLLGASVDAALAFQGLVAILVVGATWAVLKGAGLLAAQGDGGGVRLHADRALCAGLRSRHSARSPRVVLARRRRARVRSGGCGGGHRLGDAVRAGDRLAGPWNSGCAGRRGALLRLAAARGMGQQGARARPSVHGPRLGARVRPRQGVMYDRVRPFFTLARLASPP